MPKNQTQVVISACVFLLRRDNKSMLKSDALPTDLEAYHVLLRERLLVEEQQDKINKSLARALANAKFEIEQLERYIYGKHRKRTAHFSTTE